MNKFRFKKIRVCPHCRSEPQEGSGGWGIDFQCGTRQGNVTKEIHWRGKKCLEATNELELLEQEKEKCLNAVFGLG